MGLQRTVMIQLATMVVIAVSANLAPIQDTDDLFERFRARDWEAYAELVSIGEPVVAPLLEILADPEAGNARWMAAKALGEIGTSECTTALLEALDDTWFQVPRLAAEGLGWIGDLRARAPLEALAATDPYVWVDPKTNEEKYVVRDAAREALLRFSVFLANASKPPPFAPPPGRKLPWPFPGKFEDNQVDQKMEQFLIPTF